MGDDLPAFWLNVYRTNQGLYYARHVCYSRADADRYAIETPEQRVACVEVKWSLGDGLFAFEPRPDPPSPRAVAQQESLALFGEGVGT